MTSETTSPIHVRVAQALGWTGLEQSGHAGSVARVWVGFPPGAEPRLQQPVFVPRFDKDWAATGPLIERMRIAVCPPLHGDEGWQASGGVPRPVEGGTKEELICVEASTPLAAVCALILALTAAPAQEHTPTE